MQKRLMVQDNSAALETTSVDTKEKLHWLFIKIYENVKVSNKGRREKLEEKVRKKTN
jgi:hypothetical protein